MYVLYWNEYDFDHNLAGARICGVTDDRQTAESWCNRTLVVEKFKKDETEIENTREYSYRTFELNEVKEDELQ